MYIVKVLHYYNYRPSEYGQLAVIILIGSKPFLKIFRSIKKTVIEKTKRNTDEIANETVT